MNGAYDTLLPVTSPNVRRFIFLYQTEWQIFVIMNSPTYTALWFIVNTYFRLLPVFWHSYFARYCSHTCGEIFKYVFVANLLLSLSVKEFWKSVKTGEVINKSLVSCFWLTVWSIDTGRDTCRDNIQQRNTACIVIGQLPWVTPWRNWGRGNVTNIRHR